MSRRLRQVSEVAGVESYANRPIARSVEHARDAQEVTHAYNEQGPRVRLMGSLVRSTAPCGARSRRDRAEIAPRSRVPDLMVSYVSTSAVKLDGNACAPGDGRDRVSLYPRWRLRATD